PRSLPADPSEPPNQYHFLPWTPPTAVSFLLPAHCYVILKISVIQLSKPGGVMAGFHPANPQTIPEMGIGMLGYAFMGRAHAHAMRTLAAMMYPPPAIP